MVPDAMIHYLRDNIGRWIEVKIEASGKQTPINFGYTKFNIRKDWTGPDRKLKEFMKLHYPNYE